MSIRLLLLFFALVPVAAHADDQVNVSDVRLDHQDWGSNFATNSDIDSSEDSGLRLQIQKNGPDDSDNQTDDSTDSDS